MRDAAVVSDRKPIEVSRSVSAFNPLIAFNDIHGMKNRGAFTFCLTLLGKFFMLYVKVGKVENRTRKVLYNLAYCWLYLAKVLLYRIVN
jgi:hypothetical protein